MRTAAKSNGLSSPCITIKASVLLNWGSSAAYNVKGKDTAWDAQYFKADASDLKFEFERQALLQSKPGCGSPASEAPEQA